jgi:uncharacterized glyoxalase superfamily protein PhnB
MQPVLAVRDVLEAVHYYRDMLGFHVDFVHGDPPVHARVCADPAYSAPTVHIRFEPLEPRAVPNPSVYLWVHVGTDLDGLFAVYRDRGVKIIREPEDRPWGLRQFIIEDCGGYLISFSAELDTAHS